MAKEKIERANNVLKIYQDADAQGRKVYWIKAKCLSIFKHEELWKWLFDGEGTWGEFCDHIGTPVSSAQQKIAVWDFYLGKHKFTIDEMALKDTNCLYVLSRQKSVAGKKEIKGYIDLMDTTPRSEFLDLLKGKCKHEKTKEVKTVREVCTACKRKLRDVQ